MNLRQGDKFNDRRRVPSDYGVQAMKPRIYVEGLSFDYAHFIPSHPKCSRLHGHTCGVRVTITGGIDPIGMILDFGVIKRAAKEVLRELDHRLLVPKYLVTQTDSGYEITVDDRQASGGMFLKLPADYVFLLRDNSTVEHITETIVDLLWHQLGSLTKNLERLEVECSEGQGKGAWYVKETGGS